MRRASMLSHHRDATYAFSYMQEYMDVCFFSKKYNEGVSPILAVILIFFLCVFPAAFFHRIVWIPEQHRYRTSEKLLLPDIKKTLMGK